jgi:hypothetical protein
MKKATEIAIRARRRAAAPGAVDVAATVMKSVAEVEGTRCEGVFLGHGAMFNNPGRAARGR